VILQGLMKREIKSSRYGPYELGYKCVTMGITMSYYYVSKSISFKNLLSSDCCLKLSNMKLESLVIAYHYVAVNCLPDLVHTARHRLEIGFEPKYFIIF